MESNVGHKIRQFRMRAGLSQMELELEIDASPGSLSRIESGKINPTKETLNKISQSLKLNSLEMAYLFNIKIEEYTKLFVRAAAAVNSSLVLEEVCQIAVDKLIDELGLIAAFITIRRGEELYSITTTSNKVSELCKKVIGKPFNKLHVSVINDDRNLVVRTFLDKKCHTGGQLRNYIVPAVNEPVAILLEKISHPRSLISIPMMIGDNCMGVIVFGKNSEGNIWSEKELLQAFTDQVAIAIKNAEEFERLKKELRER